MWHGVWQVSVSLAPWLLLGAGLSGLLHVLLPPDFLQRHLTGRLGVVKAVLFGVPLPLCSCGVIPAGLGLRRDGASAGSSVGFLIATPQTGVDSMVVSASMLGWPFALFKVGAALVTGLIGGLATDRWAPSGGTLALAEGEACSASRRDLRAGFDHAMMVLQSIWRWLLFGILVSAALDAFVPAAVWTQVAGWNPGLSMLAALLISLPLYVCATASVPIAATLVAGGLPAGAALVFLMAGPATNVATIGAIRRGLGGRATWIYLVTVIAGSMLLGASFDWLLAGHAQMPAHAHGESNPIALAATVVFWALMAFFAFDDAKAALARVVNARKPAPHQVDLAVTGMSCQGCVRKLHRTLTADAEVESAEVTLEPQRARVYGPISEARVRELVAEAGYRVVEPDPDAVAAE